MISIGNNKDNFTDSKTQLNPQAHEFVPTQRPLQQEIPQHSIEQETHLHKFLSAYHDTLNIICLFPHDIKKHFHAIETAFKTCVNFNVVFAKQTIESMVKLNIEQAIKHKNYSRFSSKFCYLLDVLLYKHPSSTCTNLLAEEISIVYIYKKFINLITEFYFEDILDTQDFHNFCCVISDYFISARNRNQQPYPFLGQALVRLLYELLNSNGSNEHLHIVHQLFDNSLKTLIISEEYNKEHLNKLKALVQSRITLVEKESEKYTKLSKIHDMIVTIEFNHNVVHSNVGNGPLENTQEPSELEGDKPVYREEEWDDFLDQFGDPVCDPQELSSLQGTTNSH